MHMKKGLQKKVLGFTLVEIMIVVTIIGILASLAVPAFQRARWKALETSIRNNLRQIWGAAQQYMLENGVNEVEALSIVAWTEKGKSADSAQGTNEGYTSVIQQIAAEDYNQIGIYTSDNIASFTSEEENSDGISTFDSLLTEDTQGLIIKADNKRYVKLRL